MKKNMFLLLSLLCFTLLFTGVFAADTYCTGDDCEDSLFILSEPLYYITLTESGWDWPAAGTWDAESRIAVLGRDINVPIIISTNNITLDGNGHNLISKNYLTGYGVSIRDKTNVTVKNLHIRNFDRGIRIIANSSDCIIAGVDFSGNDYGIFIDYSDSITVIENTITGNNYGAQLSSTTDTTLTGNTITHNKYYGLAVKTGRGNMLSDNTVENNGEGILLDGSGQNWLTVNDVRLNDSGIRLNNSGENILNGNLMSGNKSNFRVSGTSGEHFDNDVYANNSVDGRPILYLKDATGITLDGSTDAATVFLINCSQITLSGLHVSGCESGVFLWNTHNSRIENVLAEHNSVGIRLNNSTGNHLINNVLRQNNYGTYMIDSAENTIEGNLILNNSFGIALENSSNCEITGNETTSNKTTGIYLSRSTGNTVRNNLVADSINGIDIKDSQHNTIYHNNFINNRNQAQVSGSSHILFSLAWPVGGNFWSDWIEPDNNGDGFVDFPYTFSGGRDELPWARENGWRDETAPQTDIFLDGMPGNNGWYVSPVVITLAAADNDGGSGVWYTEYSFDNEYWRLYGSPFTVVDEVSTIYYRSVDNAGNVEETKYLTAKSDTLPPLFNICTPEPYAVLPVGTVMIFDAEDDLSGVQEGSLSAQLESDMFTAAVSGSSTLTKAGVYTLTVSAADEAGNTATETRHFVVYDPEGGFVTGSGWIDSPTGAFTADPSLQGKANFGFVAKYHRGASIPDGQTAFLFKTAGLNFHSSAYEWLVVSGSKAQFKGTGTINGSGEFGFMLTATEGKSRAADLGRFRIKIWDRATEAIIYDNQAGDDDSDPQTALGGGSIVIHRK